MQELKAMSSLFAHRWETVFVLVCGSSLLGAAHAADVAAAKAAAKVILQEGWGKTQAAREIVDQQFAAAEPKAPRDPFLLGAHWMALVNQSRWKEARQSVDTFLVNYPSYVPALHAKVCLCTVLKEYQQAMETANALARAIAQNPPADDEAARAIQDQATEFIGVFAGYLEGPLEDTFDQAKRRKFEAELLKALDAPRKEQFQKGKEAVFTKLEKLQNAATGEEEKQKEQADTSKEKKLKSLEDEKDKIAGDAKNVDERAKQTEADLKRLLAKLNQQLAAEGARITQWQNQVRQLQTQLTQDQENSRQARKTANDRKNDQFAERDALQKESTARNTKFQIDTLNNYIAAAQPNYNAIQQQIQTAQAGGAIQGQQLDDQRRGLDKDKLRIDNRAKREQGKNNSPKALALETQSRSFSTYFTLPLEDLRASLLARLQ
jgi:hypothetical protein